MATYTITKIKTFNGREGQGLNATICKDGKAICYVMDDASGGDVDYDYRNPKQNATSFHATTKEMAEQAERELGEYCWSLLTPTEQVEEMAGAQEMKSSYAPELKVEMYVHHSAVETWVNNFVDALSNKKRMDRIAKTKTLFRLQGDSLEEWRTLKRPYDTEVQKLFDTNPKYVGRVVAIYGVNA